MFKKWAAAAASLLCSAVLNPAEADPVLIQTKSFIARVDITDSSQFADDASCKQGAMAALIDCAMLLGENPKNGDVASGDFRLYSQLSGQATCSGNQIANWSLSPVTIKSGNEFIFLATQADLSPALSVKPAATGSNAPLVSFSYRMRGAPNDAGISLMNKVKHRTCSKIWHRVDGELRCVSGKLQVKYAVKSSAFPSVRSWNSGAVAVDRPQDPFKSLWDCDNSEADLVR